MAGKEAELWGFSLATGWIQRGDGKFHAAGVVAHPGGWNLAAIVEEPNVIPPSDRPHIVGHIIVEMKARGHFRVYVRVRKAKGLNGEILELKPSSLSKGELDASGREPDAIFEANPQRLQGMIAVYRHDVEFPDEESMTPAEFVAQSTDSRSITALAKLGLL